ncbi:hypothetical protein CDZ96_15235 [Mameliella alba]|nr:hypothetical protein CDZ96_15235 [Mameliella alba]
MASVWALVLLLVTVAFEDIKLLAGCDLESDFLNAVLIAALPFLSASILGARQLDNYCNISSREALWSRDEPNDMELKRKLKEDLELDALLKEDLLWVSQSGAQLFILFFVLAFYISSASWL